MRISVFGLGYVGTVSAGCLAKEGHQIIGVDISREKVEMINAGRTPIIEAQMGEILADVLQEVGELAVLYLPAKRHFSRPPEFKAPQ